VTLCARIALHEWHGLLGNTGSAGDAFKGVLAPLSKLVAVRPHHRREETRGVEIRIFEIESNKVFSSSGNSKVTVRRASDVETCVKFCIWRRVVCGTVKVHSTASVQAYSTCTPVVLRQPE
jgi:hypothetical protein